MLNVNWRLKGHLFRIHDTRYFEHLFVPFFILKTVLNAASWVLHNKRFECDRVTWYITRVDTKQSKYGG